MSAIATESSQFRDQSARRIRPDPGYGDAVPGQTVRVYEQINVRPTHADLLAKLKLHASTGR